ncbi:MAG: RNA polymerase sigma factor [Acidobacteriota bacterium]
MTDEDLMEAVRAGDFDALGTLFERHHRRVYGYLRGRGLSSAESEDAVQEAFARVLRYRKSYRPGARFLPWFLTVVRRSTLPRRLRREAPEPAGDAVEPAAEPDFFDHRRVEIGELRRAIGELPESQREALLLSHFEELSSEETAEILGIRPGTARVRVHRAVERLKQILNGGDS